MGLLIIVAFGLLGLGLHVLVLADLQCSYNLPAVPSEWVQMTNPCLNAIRGLINQKINNTIQYLALGSYFLKDNVNRPGFGNLFVKTAFKNRETAIEMIDYLNMRGQNTQGLLFQLNVNNVPSTTTWNSLVKANDFVLKFEAATTDLYHNALVSCENQTFDDYHVVNKFAREFLQEQYDDEKYFADRDSSLRKMLAQHKKLGEFLYDDELYLALCDDDDNDDEDDVDWV